MVVFKITNLRFLAFVFLLLTLGCYRSSKDHVVKNEIQDFDVTPDGEHIIVSWKSDRGISLYKLNIDGTNPKLLIASNGGILFENPSCSVDGQKITFLVSTPKSLTSSIYTMGINGDSLTQITSSKTLKIEAVFSSSDESIYFTQANEYASYSMIGHKAPHGIDLYKVRLKDKKVSKISNLNAYSLHDITDIDSSRLLLSLKDKDDGIFFYNKNGSGLVKIVTTNDTLRNSKSYSNPIMISTTNIICSSSYQLVNINLEAKEESQLLPSTGAHFKTIRYNKRKKAVFFTKTDDTNTIHSINEDGSDLKDIPINIVIK